MRTIVRPSSTQVLDGGRLVCSYPTREEAEAFVSGYESGLSMAAATLQRRIAELQAELKEMGT